jgi:hypothetical protein
MPLFRVRWKETAVIDREATFEAEDRETAEDLIRGGDRFGKEITASVTVSDYHSFRVTLAED